MSRRALSLFLPPAAARQVYDKRVSEVEAAERLIKDLQLQVTGLETRRKGSSQTVQEWSERVASCQRDVQRTQGEVVALEAVLEAIAAAIGARRAAISEGGNLSRALSASQLSYQRSIQQLNTLTDETDRVESELARAEGRLAAARAAQSDARERLEHSLKETERLKEEGELIPPPPPPPAPVPPAPAPSGPSVLPPPPPPPVAVTKAGDGLVLALEKAAADLSREISRGEFHGRGRGDREGGAAGAGPPPAQRRDGERNLQPSRKKSRSRSHSRSRERDRGRDRRKGSRRSRSRSKSRSRRDGGRAGKRSRDEREDDAAATKKKPAPAPKKLSAEGVLHLFSNAFQVTLRERKTFPFPAAAVLDRMNRLDPSFKIAETDLGGLDKLIERCVEEGYVTVEKGPIGPVIVSGTGSSRAPAAGGSGSAPGSGRMGTPPPPPPPLLVAAGSGRKK